MEAKDLNTGLYYTFRPGSRDRETLPVIKTSCEGREIDYPHDCIGTIRIWPNDIVKLVEIRPDSYSVLISHPRATGLCITDIKALQPADQPNQIIE